MLVAGVGRRRLLHSSLPPDNTTDVNRLIFLTLGV